jgi:hypothetical protein
VEGVTARIAAHPGPRPSISLGIEFENTSTQAWSGTLFEPIVPWDLRAWVDGRQVSVRQPPLDIAVRPRRLRLAPGERTELPSPIVLAFDDDESPFVWVLATPPAAVELQASIEVDGEPVAMERIEVRLPHVA